MTLFILSSLGMAFISRNIFKWGSNISVVDSTPVFRVRQLGHFRGEQFIP